MEAMHLRSRNEASLLLSLQLLLGLRSWALVDQEPSCPGALLGPSIPMTGWASTLWEPTHSSSSVERGRDGWQENHYLRYDYPSSSPVLKWGQQVQTFPSSVDQSLQNSGGQEKADKGKSTCFLSNLKEQEARWWRFH